MATSEDEADWPNVVAAEDEAGRSAVVAAEDEIGQPETAALEAEVNQTVVVAVEAEASRTAVVAAEDEASRTAVFATEDVAGQTAVVAAEDKAGRTAVVAAEDKTGTRWRRRTSPAASELSPRMPSSREVHMGAVTHTYYPAVVHVCSISCTRLHWQSFLIAQCHFPIAQYLFRLLLTFSDCSGSHF